MEIFWKIEMPASMPALMAGLRIGATLAVIGVTVGELVGGNTGPGISSLSAKARPIPQWCSMQSCCSP